MTTKAFISSTSRDLVEYRQAAIEVCIRLDIIPIAMEFFEATSDGATIGSKRKLDDANLYIGIFAHRYGYIESGYKKSVTHLEYDYALEQKLDRLCFLVDPEYPWPTESVDHANYNKLENFKASIESSVIRSLFTDVNDFKLKLYESLRNWIQNNTDNKLENLLPPENILWNTLPPAPQLILGRDKQISEFKELLGLGTSIVVHGWPGVGKTTLMSAIANDPEVQAKFPDGVFWATLGTGATPQNELMRWGRQLGINMTNIRDLEDAMNIVRVGLKDKQALLLIDDLWESSSATPFKLGGPKCFTIFTTRFPDVSREIALTPHEIYRLNTLEEEDSFALMEYLAPSVSASYPNEILRLIENLEGLPLALRVAGRLLEADFRDGFDVTDLFSELAESHTLLDAKAPDDRFDPVTGITPTIGLLLKKSTDQLSPEIREHFAFLGAFAPKPATFDISAMKNLWQVDETRQIVRTLVDRGLLEPIPSRGRYWMHAVLVLHANAILESLDE